MTAEGLALPDTDWHVARLYDFVEDLGASMIVASFSRYVVDLNRSSGDEALYENRVSTGLCPVTTFAGAPIYLADAEVTAAEQALRVEEYSQKSLSPDIAELAKAIDSGDFCEYARPILPSYAE